MTYSAPARPKTRKAKLKPRLDIGQPFTPGPKPIDLQAIAQVQAQARGMGSPTSMAPPAGGAGVQVPEPATLIGNQSGKAYATVGDRQDGKPEQFIVPSQGPDSGGSSSSGSSSGGYIDADDNGLGTWEGSKWHPDVPNALGYHDKLGLIGYPDGHSEKAPKSKFYQLLGHGPTSMATGGSGIAGRPVLRAPGHGDHENLDNEPNDMNFNSWKDWFTRHPDAAASLPADAKQYLAQRIYEENQAQDGPPADADYYKLPNYHPGMQTDGGVIDPRYMTPDHKDRFVQSGGPTSMATGGIGMAGSTQSIDDPIARQLRQRQAILNAQNNVPGNDAAAKAQTLQTDENSVFYKMGVNAPTSFNVPNNYTGSVSPLTQTSIRSPAAYQQDANNQENLSADQAEYARQQSQGQSNVGFKGYGQPRMDGGNGGSTLMEPGAMAPRGGGGGSGGGLDPSVFSRGDINDPNFTGYMGGGYTILNDPTTGQALRVKNEDAAATSLALRNKPLNQQAGEQALSDRPKEMQLAEQDKQAQLNGLVPYDDPTQGHVYLTPTEAKIRKARDTRDTARAIEERYPTSATGLDKLSPDDAIQGLLHPEDLASAFGGDPTKATTMLNQYLQDKGYSPRAIDIQVAQARAAESKKKLTGQAALDKAWQDEWEKAFPDKPFPGAKAAETILGTGGASTDDTTSSTSSVPGEDASAIDAFIKKNSANK